MLINRINGQLTCDTMFLYSMFKTLFDKCDNEIEVNWLRVHIDAMINASYEEKISELNKSLKG